VYVHVVLHEKLSLFVYLWFSEHLVGSEMNEMNGKCTEKMTPEKLEIMREVNK
jgi:hypothetical protein